MGGRTSNMAQFIPASTLSQANLSEIT